MTYHRRPARYAVRLDGRTMGQPFRTAGMARAFADELQGEAPWAVVEVVTVW